MNINYVVKCIEVMKELSDNEKGELILFINSNVDDIEIEDDLVEGGPNGIDYYDVHLNGPGQFCMHFSVGTISDYLKLWELSDEFSLNTFNCKTSNEDEEY